MRDLKRKQENLDRYLGRDVQAEHDMEQIKKSRNMNCNFSFFLDIELK